MHATKSGTSNIVLECISYSNLTICKSEEKGHLHPRKSVDLLFEKFFLNSSLKSS